MKLKKLRTSRERSKTICDLPAPMGSYVAMVFRVVGYDADSDAERTPLAKLENVDFDGNALGWNPDRLILAEDNAFVLENLDDICEILE